MDGYMIGGDFDKYSYEKRNWYIRNFCTTELNKDTPLLSLSYYLTAGKDRNFITSRIPLPKEEICNLASLGNTAKDGVSITDCGYFYIVKSKQPLCVISVVYNNLLTKLKEKLLNVNVTCSNMDIDKVCRFEYGNEHYYIVYNNQEHPLKIIDAHQKEVNLLPEIPIYAQIERATSMYSHRAMKANQ